VPRADRIRKLHSRFVQEVNAEPAKLLMRKPRQSDAAYRPMLRFKIG